jgi:hypothetical protein
VAVNEPFFDTKTELMADDLRTQIVASLANGTDVADDIGLLRQVLHVNNADAAELLDEPADGDVSAAERNASSESNPAR